MTGFNTAPPLDIPDDAQLEKRSQKMASTDKIASENGTDSFAAPVGVHIRERDVSFAEFKYWALKSRECEKADKESGVATSDGFLSVIKGRKADAPINVVQYDDSLWAGLSERERELTNARRVLRQAGWATVFFLVTCDILGPFNAPYAISQIGMVPGVLLYILFGAIAFITGCMLSWLYCRLDSARYPVKTYGELAQRTLGRWSHHLCTFLQTTQLILNVGIICLSNGQGLYQIIEGGGKTLCFTVCIVIWSFVGMGIGQIRGLKNFTYLANFTVWFNVLLMILSMAFVANSPPNYAAAVSTYGAAIASGPKNVVAAVSSPLFSQVNGVFNMVFAYGGAMIFPEIMAEMRRPRDFIKGMACAQLLIFVAYLFYGVFIYSFQGQYTLPLAYQGVSKYAWQTVGNVIALITGIIAAGLYGNIGLKIFYINVIESIFNGPTLMSAKGRVLWAISSVIYWSIAFVIGTGIPAIGALSGLVAACCIFQFTYTFPPAMMLGYQMREDASQMDGEFTTPGVAPMQIDSWRQYSRWHRGFFSGTLKSRVLKVTNLLFLLAALATAALGMWATGTALRETIAAGAASSFGCTGPV